MNALPRIRAGLLKHPLDQQVMVYDTALDRVHLLDPTTACVLELLEEGTHTAEEISAQIVARLDLAPNPGFLSLAIDELRKAELLEQGAGMHAPLMDRRELLQKVAMTGAAALLVPTVASLTATRGYAQGTAPNHGVCNSCTDSSQCISSQCCNGMCMVNCTGNGVGACCNVGTQCTSGTCTGGFCTAPLSAACGPCTTNANCVAPLECSTSVQAPTICVNPTTCLPKNADCLANCDCCSGFCNGNKCKE